MSNLQESDYVSRGGERLFNFEDFGEGDLTAKFDWPGGNARWRFKLLVSEGFGQV